MTAKFKLGDYVKLGKRETAAISGHAFNGEYQLTDRRRARRIARIVYDRQQECNYYYLGTNHRGKSDMLSTIGFRSYQLEAISEMKRGRPRQKRRYTRWQN